MTIEFPLDRRDRIARRLAEGQAVVAVQLAVEFAVSEDAIRRDLRALAAEGRCRRVYGGALPVIPNSPPMAQRIGQGRPQKDALAQAAVKLITPGDVLFLDSGSTNFALAGQLPEDFDLIVATNSIDIARSLASRLDIRLILIGGAVNPTIGGCVDAVAIEAVGRLNVDRCFLGVCAISVDHGIGAFELDDACFKRALVASSRECSVLATTDKLGARAPHKFAAIRQIVNVVVEHDAPDDDVARIGDAGPAMIRAEAVEGQEKAKGKR